MAAAESKTAVIAAIVGNLAIAVAKFAAAAFSGSAAMLSEAIHSLVDTGNDALMLYGIRRSAKPPDHDHPFGYGHELYFWTLVVGVLIFAVGGGMSIVSGVLHIVNGTAAEADVWNYAVLGVAAVFESISWYFGLRAFRKEQAGRGVIETIKVSKDPTTFSVLLCAIALVMVYESKSLLVGEGVSRATAQAIRDLIGVDADVDSVGRLATMYLGPDEVMLAVEVHFRPERSGDDRRRSITRMTRAIQDKYPRIRHVFLDASWLGGE